MLGELTKNDIEDVLSSNVIGRIGCCAEQKMYVVPITYVYDGEFILGHTAEGTKVNLLRQNPECCFEVDVMKDLANWQSVIVWGTFEELKGDEAEKAVAKLLNKLSPLMPSETSRPQRMGQSSSERMSTYTKNPIIYRIRLKEKSGRYERQ
jgi:nitroimidazol reductase NimA-like FMN-containing flavoprotein (pyridoxamine 5'-phosphate oxidase superfamily)